MDTTRAAAELVRISGRRIDLRDLERKILRTVPASQCAVVAERDEAGQPYLAVFLVPRDQTQRGDYAIDELVPESLRPVPVVQLANLPRTSTGAVDKQALAALGVASSAQIREWESRLEQVESIRQAAVVQRQQFSRNMPLHLSDLFPELAQEEMVTAQMEQVASGEEVVWELPPALVYGGDRETDPGTPVTLIQALERASREHPDKGIIYLLPNGSEIVQTYPELVKDASQVLAGLRRTGLQPQERVILQLGANQDFIPAFWACVLGGFIPVPVAVAPTYAEMNAVVSKLKSTWELLGRPAIITDEAQRPGIAGLSQLWQTDGLRVLTIESLRGHDPDWQWHQAKPEDLVFHLLSSGSTGTPKVIQHCHRSTLARIKATAVFNQFTSDEVSLNWLPLDHVGGIVMFHVRDVYLGCRHISGKIESVIASPLVWLDWVHKYRVTATWAPNFAFSLVNDNAESMRGGHWDLSCLRYIMNAGEGVSSKTAHRFLELCQPFGLPATAMVPAYGMSETSSAIVQSKRFTTADLSSGVQVLDNASLKGRLQPVSPDHPRALVFTEVGEPIPTVWIRIVDAENRVLPEDHVGRLQVSGPTIMYGYYNNPKANAEAYVAEGWFNTGDLAFIHRGRLVVTGREKDVIIINGANYLNSEVEAVVEEVPGVEVTFAAAGAVAQPGQGSDVLAVFFVPADGMRTPRLPQVVREIRQAVVRRVGVEPRYVIPVEKDRFPKTNSGKIQRNKLTEMLAAGEFAEIQKWLDVHLENDQTIPSWFYEPGWVPQQVGEPEENQGAVLLFQDGERLGSALQERLQAQERPLYVVRPGDRFQALNGFSFEINPENPDDYVALLDHLRSALVPVRDVLHLWNYDSAAVPESLEGLRLANRTCVLPVLNLLQALDRAQAGSVRLILATSQGQNVTPGDRIDPAKSLLPGLLKTAQQEWSDWQLLHVDLPAGEPRSAVLLLEAELRATTSAGEVAYRMGQRLVQRLRPYDVKQARLRPKGFADGGIVLMTGGLGSIGTEVAKNLLRQFRVRLLLLGRSEIDPNDPGSEKARNLRTLQQMGEVLYSSADVSDPVALRGAIDEAEQQWQKRVTCALHLAGVGNVAEHWSSANRYMLRGETPASFFSQLQAKVDGAWALAWALRDHPETELVFFSSVNGFFGGTAFGAYSAANAFLAGFAVHLRYAEGRPALCIDWSMWQDLGMNRDNPVVEAALQRGFQPISRRHGWYSLLLAMGAAVGHLLVGLDGSNWHVKRYLDPIPLPQLLRTAYYTAAAGMDEAVLRTAVNGAHQAWSFMQVDDLPRLAGGMIDRKRLEAIAEGPEAVPAFRPPQAVVEKTLAAIWRSILQVDRVGLDDDFFALGGHSLKAMQMIARFSQEFGVQVPLHYVFEHTTCGQLAHAIAGLLEEQKQEPEQAQAAIPTLPAQPQYEVSYAQRRVWFLTTMEERKSSYNILGAWEIKGTLNLRVFREAVQHLARRHQALRATFRMQGSVPVQMIADRAEIPVAVLDLTVFNTAAQEEQINRLIRAEADQEYNLEIGPLTKVTLVRMAAADYVLLIAQHHIISDGWSLGILVREMGEVYSQLLPGRQPDLPALGTEYVDYIAWHNQQVDKMEADRAYWFDKLGGDLPVLDLPADHPRPPVQMYRGATEMLFIEPELTGALHELNRRYGTTMFMTLLTAFKVMLHKLTGQTDLIVGAPVAGRKHPEVQQLAGMFVNTLAFRTDLGGNPAFTEVLHMVKEGTLEGYGHQDYPFDKLVEKLNPLRDLSTSPIFQVMMGYLNVPLELVLPDMAIAERWVEHRVAKFDLTLHVFERQNGLVVHFEYNTDLFDRSTVQRWMNHFRTLLQGIARNPAARLSELTMLTEAERRQVLVEWNRTATPFPAGSTIQELFAQQAELTPDAVAVTFQGRHLTYRELDRLATALAGRLQAMGVGPDTLVATLFESSFEMIVAIVAIIKAGGAYVPIAPEFPAARIQLMLRDTRSWLLLTQSHLVERLPESVDCTVLCVDREEAGEAPPYNMADSMAGPKQTAYVNYTSGSTGVPKGVLIPHVGVVRLVKGARYVELGPGVRMLQVSNAAFDAFTLELWGSLLNGGELVLIPKYAVLDFNELARAFEEHTINAGFLTAALFNHLIEFRPESLRHFKTLIVGGEALSVPHIRKALQYLPEGLVNGYGPTENTTFSTWHPIRELAPDRTSVPIGRPLSNSVAVILDEHLQPVPIGVKGEIYLGGHGLASGYLNDPGRTAERFIANPFPELPTDRMYKSGDLGRWLPDGTIEYLGRMDRLVKIRGYRIECGEVEAALLRHEGVQRCVVAPREDAAGHKRLVAYLVAEPGGGPPDWRSFLREKLPDYMIPSHFVVVDSLPLTRNGKVDVDALPNPTLQSLGSHGHYVAPRTDLEQTIAAVWQSVLGVERVGVEDSFFDLGGDSIMSIQLVGKLNELGFRVDPKMIFLYQTVGALAERIASAPHAEGGRTRTVKDYLVELRSGAPERSRIFFAPPAGGTVMGYIELARQLREMGTVYGLQAPGLNEDEEPQYLTYAQLVKTFVGAVEGHFRPRMDYLAGHSMGGHVAFGMCQELVRRGQPPKGLIILDTTPSMRNPKLDKEDQQTAELSEDELKMLVLVLGMGNLVGLSPEQLHGLDYETAKRRILDQANKDELVHTFMNDVYLDKYLRLQMHNLLMSQVLELDKTPIPVPIIVAKTTEHPPEFEVQFADWKQYTTASCEYVEIPGNHVTMMRSPNVHHLVARIQHILERTSDG